MCWISCIFLHERMVHFQEYQPMNKIYQLRNQNINSTKDKNSFFGGAKLLFSNRNAKKDGISMLVHNSNSNYLYSPCRPVTCVHKEWCQKLFKLEIISEFFAAHRVKPFGMCCPFSRRSGKLKTSDPVSIGNIFPDVTLVTKRQPFGEERSVAAFTDC